MTLPITKPSPDLVKKVADLKPQADAAKKAFQDYLDKHPNESQFQVSDAGKPLKDAAQKTDEDLGDAQRALDTSGVSITIRYGEVIIFVTSMFLMVVLTYLVKYTKRGRAMRAVSHDFDSASLMGINVNSIVTFTFVLGSALAGAGAMMQATFKGATLTTFFGLLPGVKAFVAAVLGGIGNIPGAVLGGILMGLAETLVVWMGYSRYADAIAFVILILVLLLRPGGLLGSDKVEKV
jgi:branched-chain amino acid transport system permease protein